MNKAESYYRVAVDGHGSIEVRGTSEFVAQQTPYMNGVVADSLLRYIEGEVAKGRDRAAVVREVQDRMAAAMAEAGITTA